MLSILTPVHHLSTTFLPETYQSLLSQTYQDWEWILLQNNGGKVPDEIAKDNKVVVFTTKRDLGIGALKRFCASKAKGDILVELDADDLLTSNALAKISDAFKNPNIAMVYSNSAEFKQDTWDSEAYSNYWGWESRDFEWQGHILKEMIAWEPSAHMMRQIFWSPNHVRAWRAIDYWKVGGHNEALKVGDDHELNCRFYIEYGEKRIKHIDECLYLYRVHGQNTCVVHNAEVQKISMNNYLKYSRDMAVRWANDNNLRLLDLGGRFDAWQDFETVDLLDADIITDLNKKWPFEDNSVGIIRASHIFEHLKDSVHTMNEAFRVLAPGGWLFVEVPSTDGRGAFQDPTHVSFWNENSIWYYTDRNYAKYISPAYKGKFQVSRVVTYFPDETMKKYNIPIVQADLICLKPPYSNRPVGETLI
jgi:glycosyltransferase involved in cell wall biosynthesis